MTREELKQAGTKKLISALQYCGRDSYYATYYDEVVDEITQRLNCIEELNKENGKLEGKLAELKKQIEKMKCCENCKYNSYWGNELHCNYGLKEALQEDRLVECNKMDKWEIKEK